MDYEKAKTLFVNFVENEYARNDKPDFDITPMIHMVKNNEIEVYMMPDGHPMTQAKMIAVGLGAGADIFLFVSSIWIKNPETGARVGEGVMIVGETPTTQELISYRVKRDPLPVLEKYEGFDTFKMRVDGFIYQSTEATP